MLLNTDATPFTDIDSCLAWLRTLDVSVMKLGTERVTLVLKALNNPQNTVHSIHIIGTNGKGSVSALLESVYRQASYRTMWFTSPHLIDVRERIRINGQWLSETEWLNAARAVYSAMVEMLPERVDWLSYFEFLTAMMYWSAQALNVDVAIVEAGLGGRFDATNVLAQPSAVVITPISLDHTERLGNTLAAIAGEKAAVIKANCPVLSAPQTPEAKAVIEWQANRANAPLTVCTNDVIRLGPLESDGDDLLRPFTYHGTCYYTSLLGRYQQVNLALACGVIAELQARLSVSDESLALGLRHVHWPGRMQWLPQAQCFIDGSHNAQGMQSLMDTLHADFPGRPLHFGISLRSNRPLNILTVLIDSPQTHSITPIIPPHEHAGQYHSVDEIKQFIAGQRTDLVIHSPKSAAKFCTQGQLANHLTVLTGSLYTAGEGLKTFA